MTRQFPTSFQFGDLLLETLAEHAYSGRFGTFLEISDRHVDGPVSLWSWINVVSMNSNELCNYNYDENENAGALFPIPNIPWLALWTWFNRLKQEPHLQEAAIFGVMQLEKLQSRYKDEYKRYDQLLHKLSIVDANSPATCGTPINSRAGPRFDFAQIPLGKQRRPSWGSYPESLSTLASDGEVSAKPIGWMKHRAKSLDNITSLNGSTKSNRKSFYPKRGKSKFFVRKNQGHCRHLSLPGEWNSPVKVTDLKEYLRGEGLTGEVMDGVQVSKLTCRGYLVKRGNIHKTWRRRWFVLDITKRYAAYFESPTSEHPKGVISFRQICDVYAHAKQHKNPHLFVVETLNRKFYIKAPTRLAMEVWLTCFNVPVSAMGGGGEDSPGAFRRTLERSVEYPAAETAT